MRIAYIAEGDWIPHPTYQEGDESTFELVVAGRQLDDGDVAIMMVEAGGTEKAWELLPGRAPRRSPKRSSPTASRRPRPGSASRSSCSASWSPRPAPTTPIPYVPQVDYGDDVCGTGGRGRHRAGRPGHHHHRQGRAQRGDRRGHRRRSSPSWPSEFEGREKEIKAAVRSLTKQLVRQRIVDEGVRMDGRGPTDIRPVSAEVGIIPTAHGSGLFQRGETQVLNVTTLGMPRMDQLLDTIGIDEKKRYMHHYNMPPYANGETGRVGSPKRREIGHGLLAERALLPVVPSVEEFPYALRLVSEVLAPTARPRWRRCAPRACRSWTPACRSRRRWRASPWAWSTSTASTSPSPTSSAPRTPSATWTSRWPARPSSSPPCSSTPRSTACPPTCSAPPCARPATPGSPSWRSWTRPSPSPGPTCADTAPKIVSLEIPIDKIGEVIGPKGKVINALQQETGADIASTTTA